MPNWVRNVAIFNGTKEQIQELEEFCANMDFNKIRPMPSTLDIEASSQTKYAVAAYVYFVLKDPKKLSKIPNRFYNYSPENILLEIHKLDVLGEVSPTAPFGEESEDISYLFSCKPPKCRADFILLGKIGWENLEDYGAIDWHDWRGINWGTKSNACERSFDSNPSRTSILYRFDTAWSAPIGIIEEIFKHIEGTDIAMIWDYADEDIGRNCGRLRKDFDSHQLVSSEEESTEFAKKVWSS